MSEIHDNAVAYALTTLDAAEQAEFETHLDACVLCQGEVAEFRETAADLDFLTQAPPPPSLRASVLAAIRRLPQLPAEDEIRTASPRPRAVMPESWLSHELSSRALDHLELHRQRRRNTILRGLVAALLIVVVGLGGIIYALGQQRNAAVAAAPAYEKELLQAEDVQVVVAAALQGEGQCTFIASRKLNRALYLGTGMPDPGEQRHYQLWTVTGTPPEIDPTLDNSVPDDRPARQFFSGDVSQADFLAVSIERNGTTPDVPTENQVVALAPLA